MKKSLKRVLSIILTVALVIGLMPRMSLTAYADNTVTWTADQIARIYVDLNNGNARNNSYSGITVTGSNGGSGIWMGSTLEFGPDVSTYTFTSTVGNISSIVISASDVYAMDMSSGWNATSSGLSWSGTPAASVTMSARGYADGVSQVVFTIESSSVDVSGVSIKQGENTVTEITLEKNATTTLTAVVAPENATDKTIIWSSGNDDVATVDSSGNVTAVGDGKVNIYATATNGTDTKEDDIVATCGVTVTTLYPLWVGETQVTGANASNITGAETATASYDADTNTLTLNGYTYEGEGYSENKHNGAIFYKGNQDISIVLTGENTITSTYGTGAGICIYGSGVNCTISGTGSLTTSGPVYGIINDGQLTINSGNITATATSNTAQAIRGTKGVNIYGGTVEVDSTSYGITGNETKYKLTIGENAESVVIVASACATDFPVINAITGTGWTDKAGTEGKTDIAVSTEGQNLANYKNLQFPAALEKQDPTASDFTFMVPADLVYDGDSKSVTVEPAVEDSGMGDITVKYFSDAERKTEVQAEDVKNAGDYYVGIEVAEGTAYNAATLYDDSWTFTIDRFNTVLSWGNTTLNYTGEKLLPEVTIQDMPEGDDVVVELTGAGIDIGYYTAEFAGLSGEDAGNYEEPTDNLSKIFSIVKNSSEISVSIEDWTYGDKAKSPVVTGVPEGKEAVIEYKPLDGNTFTEEIPTEAGKYTVRATLAGDDTSETVSAVYNFSINPKEVTIVWGKTSFVYNGEDQIPTASLEGILEADAGYVEADVIGEAASAGDHTARVIGLTGDAASNYKLPANTKTAFTIDKADIDEESGAEVNMEDWVYGDNPSEPVVTNNISGGAVSYSYLTVTWSMALQILELLDSGTEEQQEAFLDSLDFVAVKPSDAGMYLIKAEIAATENYNEVELYNGFIIDKRVAKLEWGETSFVYDGDLHIPECKVTNLVNGDECDVIVKSQASELGAYNDGESAVGIYSAEAFKLSNPNYDLTEADDIITQFTISEQPLSITVSIEDWTYGDYTSTPIIRGNKGNGAESFTYYLDEDCILMTTSYEGAETDGGIPSFAGKYYVKANVEATEIYTAAEATAEFTIGKRKLDVGWYDTEFTYDGMEHAPSVDALNPADGDNIEFIVSGAGISAGEYEAEAYIVDGMLAENYEIPERITQKFTIAKKEAELKWGETEFIYNGHDQVPTVEVSNLEEGDVCIPVVVGAATAVGEHIATVVRLSNSNYELPENIEMDFTIVKADIPGYESDDPVMVEIDDWNYGDEPETPYLEGYTGGGTVRYSYLEITPKIMDDFMELDVGGASREEILAYFNGLPYTTAIPKNAGFYILRADINATENYNESVRFCSFIIFPKPVEVEWGETTFEYDGEEHVPDCKVVGLINGDECDVMVDGAEIEVGEEYEAEVTGLTNPNYEPVDDFSQTFSIIKAYSGISVYIDDWTYGEEGFNPECEGYDGDGEVIYTYYKDEYCTEKTTEEDGAEVAGGKPSFAGEYMLEAYVAETDHYEECRDTIELYISKRKADIEWSKDSFVYNGKEQAPEATAANPAEGDKVELIVSGAGTDVGKYVAEAEFADEAVERNYFITKGDETKAFEITKKVAELSWGETEFVYNGKDQIPEVSVSNLEDGDSCNLTVTGEATAVGKHKATVIKLSNKNYELPDEIQKEFNIVKADLIDVSVSLDGWVYDESPKVPVVEGNVEGANVTYKYKAADADDSAYTTTVPSNAGDYTVMAVIDATAGYNRATVTADFTIDKAKSKVVKKPVPREDAVFMGCDQALIIEGEAFGGKIIYAHGDSNTEAPEDDSYFDEMPVEYDAGVHYVWYKVQGDANHYDSEPECLEVTIAPKEATITCNSADKVYGEEDPELTAVDEGFIGYYAPEYEVVREEGNDVGEYVITVEIEEDTNYDLTIVEGTFTISKKAAVIKAEDKTRTYGEEDPELTAVVEGVLDGDELDYTLKRKPGNTIGTYAITVKPGDNPNYEVATEGATFTIEKGKATITADDITKKVGEADPDLTATVEGVAKGDALSYALQRKEGNTPGTYEIKVIPGVNKNYDVTAVNGTFTILDKIPFVDVPRDSYYYESVYWAVEQDPQITSGVDETHFNPMGICTRAQAVTFMWRANGCPVPNTANNPFTDVSEEDFYYQAVLWAVEKGITAGKTATTFAPNDPCTRAQVVSFLWRDAGSPEPSLSESPFTDVTEADGYCDAVLWAVENGITNGINANEFGVKKTCIRAQIVTFIMRAYGTK